MTTTTEYPAATKQRSKRRQIKGTYADAGWQVSAAGIIYRHNHEQSTTRKLGKMPTIDFGKRYVNDRCIGNAYLGPVPSAGDRWDTRRLLDEIVCFQFHGFPPGGRKGFTFAHVRHLDGNPWNCEAVNLRWEIDEYFAETETLTHMQPDFLPESRVSKPGAKNFLITRPSKQLLFVEGAEVSHHIPTQPMEVTEWES